MSTLSSTSTDQEVWDAYDDNASYFEDGSTSKARAFITACRILLRRRPKMIDNGVQSVTFEQIREELKTATTYVSLNSPAGTGNAGSVRYLDSSRMRD